MVRTTCLLIWNNRGIVSSEELSKTTSAASAASALAFPLLIQTLASAKAAASLMPSPIMAMLLCDFSFRSLSNFISGSISA